LHNIYILMVTISIFMVTRRRKDIAVKVSRWLDKEVQDYISDRLNKVEFPSKRNFVDKAVMRLLEEKGVRLDK